MEFLLTVIGAIIAISFLYVLVAITVAPELLAFPLTLIVAYLEAKQAPKQIEEKKEES